jgi:DNA-binding transcriptional ArsR family regulator
VQSLERSLSAREVRALAHPLRLRMLEVLRAGPATASGLARELGESSGATSYHLRELGKAGFVEEDEERGNARDRWWRRTTPLFVVSSDPAGDEEYASALSQLRAVIVKRDEQALQRYFATISDAPREWQEAGFLGGWTVFATKDEMRALFTLVLTELDKLRRPEDERPADAKQIYVTFRSLPQLDGETAPSD